ncbi:unnamed protein product [Mytilus edulis]|uniref:Uncharacterized protein n=1 Tax=Mytilus edulis TaxID=6550 RepID=A0A8S3RD73_MYTED|nr:unnamed protein product [Mytilus edulis]
MSDLLTNIQKTRQNARKAISQGILDTALFLSNVAQLKSIVDEDLGTEAKPKVAITMISLSLLIQVVIGILIILLLDVEGALIELGDIARGGSLVPVEDEITEESTLLEPESRSTNHTVGTYVPDKRRKLKSRARRMNTAILFFIFVVFCINLIINGLELSKPNTLKQWLKAYNITIPK